MKTFVIIALCAFFVSENLSQKDETFTGNCPVVATKVKFNETQYAGKWFETKRFVNTLIQGDCGRPTYVWNKKNYTVNYPTKNLNNNVTTNGQLVLKPQFNPVPGRYDVYNRNAKEKIPHLVLDTDYNSYSVVWGCALSGKVNTQRLFIYSRKNTMDAATFNRAKVLLESYRINATKLIDVQQADAKCGKM